MTSKDQTGKLSKKPVDKKIKPVESPQKPKIDWQKIEVEIEKVVKSESWNAERHRVNPSFIVGVVIKNVVPVIVSDLLD
jgi:hypothetical protein